MSNLAQRRRKDDLPLSRRKEDVFSALQREMNRVFDSFAAPFDLFPRRASDIAPVLEADLEMTWTPTVNVEDRGSDYRITVEAPGVEKNDLEITTDENGITIRGQKRHEAEEKKPNYYSCERSLGSFERTIPLPTEV